MKYVLGTLLLILSSLSSANPPRYGGGRGADFIRACNNLPSQYVSDCLSGGQTSADSVRSCYNNLPSQYVSDCLLGYAKNEDTIRACYNLPSQYVKDCFRGGVR